MVGSESILPIIITNTNWFLMVKRLKNMETFYSTVIFMTSDITGGS